MKLARALIWLNLFFVCQHLQGGWLDRKAEGWFWYEDRKKQEEEQVTEPPKILPLPSAPTPPSPLPLTAAEEMALIRKELEERLSRAILEPTEANVLSYMQMQQHWTERSAQFSQTWLKNLLTYPELDTRLTAGPVTQYGVQVQKQILREKREDKIRSLAESHGLFFFYEGNSKISQAFSFVVKEFAKKYAWQVIAISCDGVLIPGFENNQLNQGITQRLKVDKFPSLFVVEPRQQIILPIAFGLSSVDQIEENIEIQLSSHSRSSP
jgi:conjugal transfer pilus assembly protein TraF